MGWPKVTIKKPRVTIGNPSKDVGRAIGTTAGHLFAPGLGESIGNKTGADYGNKLSKWAGNQWNNVTGKNAREYQEAAGKEAERVRRQGIVDEFGAKQQADGMAYASAMSNNKGGGNSEAPGLVGQGGAPGTIGSNISNSGTF